MKPMTSENLALLERLAIVEVRQKHEQYLRVLDGILTAFGVSGEAASLDDIRAMFATYETPEMTTLSSEIEAMREAR